jgi:predicted O-methyltransferase YrrM
MGGITPPQVEKYICALLPSHDGILRERERRAAKHPIPTIRPVCGRLLYQLARIPGVASASV